MSTYSDIYKVESFNTKYLIKLDPGVNGTEVANQIRSLDPTEIYAVDSFDEEWQQSTSMNNLNIRQLTDSRCSRLRTRLRSALRLSWNSPNCYRQLKRTKPRSHIDECSRLILSTTGLDVPHREHGNHNFLSNFRRSRWGNNCLWHRNLSQLFPLHCTVGNATPNLSTQRHSHHWHIHRSDLRFHNWSNPSNDKSICNKT